MSLGVYLCCDLMYFYRRLWTAYQWYGYIPEDLPFPKELDVPSPTSQQILNVIKTVRSDLSPQAREKLPQQRARAFEAAYKTIPDKVLEKLASVYSYEFLTFDYEMRPKELFANRYKKER